MCKFLVVSIESLMLSVECLDVRKIKKRGIICVCKKKIVSLQRKIVNTY